MRNQRQKLCPQCGKPDQLEATGCSFCGHVYRTQFSPKSKLPVALFRLVSILLVGAVVGYFVWLKFAPSKQTPEQAFSPETLKELNADPSKPEEDPLTTRAKTEIENAKLEYNLPEGKSVESSDGKIHLRSGKTLTPEEYQAAKKAVQTSPFSNTPPVPHL